MWWPRARWAAWRTGAHEEQAPLLAVHVRFDDYAAVAFEVERSGELVTVFLPGSPTAWAGTTVIVDAARVTPLQVAIHEVNRVLRVLGRGTLELHRAAGGASLVADHPAEQQDRRPRRQRHAGRERAGGRPAGPPGAGAGRR